MKKAFKSKVLSVLLLIVSLAMVAACGGVMAAPPATPTSTTAPVAETVPTQVPEQPAVDIATKVSEFLTGLPSGFYAVGKIADVKDLQTNSGALIVDLREATDYAAGHIPGAVNIPIRELARNLDKIPTDKPVIMTCASGHRAAMGLAVLQILGYSNARAFPGSYKAWTDAKETVSKDAVQPVVVGASKADATLVSKADAFLSALPDGFYSIGKVSDLKDLMASGATVVDLRPADEYAEGHIPGALNIPINELPNNLDKLPKDKPLVMTCASGHRAGMALASLQLLGYTNARAFPPSFAGWKAANEQIEGASATPAFDMKAEVDKYLAGLPDGYNGIGKVADLKDLVANSSAVVIDVRPATDYAAGHIPGSANIPFVELSKNLDKIPTDKPVVVSCASGFRAAQSTTLLRLLGYDNVKAFTPSYKGWTDAKETVSTDAVTLSAVTAPKQVNPEMLAAVDKYLSTMPDGFYGIGKVDALKDLIANASPVIVDVREAKDYADGHIPGSISIPIREVAKNLDKLPKDKPLVVSCASGFRAGLTLPALQLLGYTNAKAFTPGFAGWKAANETIEK